MSTLAVTQNVDDDGKSAKSGITVDEDDLSVDAAVSMLDDDIRMFSA